MSSHCSRNKSRIAAVLIFGLILLSLLLQKNNKLLHPIDLRHSIGNKTDSTQSSLGKNRIDDDETEHGSMGATTDRTDDDSTLLVPFRSVQTVRRYIDQHSEETLLSEYAQQRHSDRKFAVAYYWCPQRAGNILHSFLNTVVWSMIHNRTVLWMYHNTSNQEADCQAVLRRASWLPSYLEWKDRLDLEDPIPVSNSVEEGQARTENYKVVLYPQIPDVLFENPSITRNAWSDHPLKTKTYQFYIQQLPVVYQNNTMELYAEGKDFLYGMLYSELFQLQKPTATYTIGTFDDNQETFSLALHSRHTVAADDGSFVPQELECLERLLEGNDDPSQVYLMSDRPKTIQSLTQWLMAERNISVITAQHDVGSGPVEEHGPWAGAGYLEDLDVAANARNGIIGDPHRSSTALLMELMEYRRHMAAWKSDQSTTQMDDLKLCKLPDKPPMGYDYGPGTPTFRHHSFLQPLAPIRIVSDFIQSTTDRQGMTVLASMDFQQPTVEQVYATLNSFLFALVNNMIFRLNCNRDDCLCDWGDSLTPKPWVKGFQSEEKNIIEVAFDDDLFWQLEANETKAKNVSVYKLRFHQLRYNISDWEDSLWDKESYAILDDLYAYGVDFLYGLLFHELLSYCPQPSTTDDDEISTDSFSLVLELDNTKTQANDVQQCIESILFSTADESTATEFRDNSCHVAIFSDAPNTDQTVLSPLVKPPNVSEHLQMSIGRDYFCVASLYSITVDDKANQEHVLENGNSDTSLENETAVRLTPAVWKQVQEVSKARAGWIRPAEVPIRMDTTSACGAFTRERLEYKRHWETWKMGREPFLIEPLPECRY